MSSVIPASTATAQFAVAHTVEEINCQSDPEPDKESDPSHHWQAQHQRDAKDYTKDWENRNKRDTKWAWTLRRDPAKHVHTKTNQDKCKKGPNISQICQIADVRDHCDAANDNTRPNSSDMRRAESRMNPREILRQQTVTRHGHEDARLAELKNQDD